MPGYSGTPLPKKLGVKPGHRVLCVGVPEDVREEILGALGPDGTLATAMRGTKPFDVIVCCAERASRMADRLPGMIARLETAGGLWLCWPKKASGVETDLSDGAVREMGLSTGLVDNKTCAVTEVYSGLRFVRRVKDR